MPFHRARMHARLAALEALSPDRIAERARRIVAALREMNRRCNVDDESGLDTLEREIVTRLSVVDR